jgi:hypothetical protein
VWFFPLLCFTLFPFVTKRGSDFIFGPGMYFQTGQVIFLPEWPKWEFVCILASFCVWSKSLMCKDAANRDSTCQSIFRRLCTAKKIEDFRLPVSRPDDVLSRPEAHLSTVPYVRTTCHPVRTPDKPASSVRTTYFFSVRTLHCIEKLLSSLRTSGHLSSPSGRPLVIDQLQILPKFRIWED